MALVLHRGADDLTRLLLGAVAVTARATLQRRLDVIVEPPDQDLCHDPMIARYHDTRQTGISLCADRNQPFSMRS